jgi:hypothetical protein
MSRIHQSVPAEDPPAWALEEANSDLFDEPNTAVIISRAWELVRAAADREDEGHDECDDPDRGGEGRGDQGPLEAPRYRSTCDASERRRGSVGRGVVRGVWHRRTWTWPAGLGDKWPFTGYPLFLSRWPDY